MKKVDVEHAVTAPARRLRPARPAAVIAVLAFAGLCASFMQTILMPLQNDLPVLLGASRDDTAWVITITLLVSAICTPISGKLGDMYGKRRVALVLMAGLVAGSLVSALVPTLVPVIIGRGLQGVGMGVIPLGISILRDVLRTDRLGTAVAIVSATLGVGGALGLPVSAIVTVNFDWHVLFWVAAFLGGVALALMAWIVPQSTLRTGGRLDVPGIAGLAIGLSCVLIVLARGSTWGWWSPTTIALLAAGAIVLVAWGWYELRTPEPLVDLRVSFRGTVLMTNLAAIAMGFAFFASNIAFPQLLEAPVETGGLGLSLLSASLVLMPAGLVMLIASPVAGRLERRWGAKPLVVAAGVILVVAYLVAFVVDIGAWSLLIVNCVLGFGIGVGFAALPTLIMQAVPVSETGAANGLNTLMRALGTSTASAAVAAVLAANSVDVGGRPEPTATGFQFALALGLAASIACAALALFIPRPRAYPGERPSLPEADSGAPSRR
ncbi:MAG: MFS transporter [Pseudoclavibacter sp.]